MKPEAGLESRAWLTFEALPARAPVAVHQVAARSSVLAGVGKTLVFVHFAVDADPACIADTLVAARGQACLLYGDRGTTESRETRKRWVRLGSSVNSLCCV